MKIAIAASTGGRVFRQTLSILRACGSSTDFMMISDRSCGAETIAEDFSLPIARIEAKDSREFSMRSVRQLSAWGGADVVMSFVLRLLTAELFNTYPCVNVHPALLPAFRGLNAIDRAYEAGVKFIGSTLHMLDEEVDHGPILAQIQMPVFPDMTWQEMIDAEFVQNVYLMLLFIDFLETGKLEVYPKSTYKFNGKTAWTDRANPCLENQAYLQEIYHLQNTLGLHVI